MQRVFVKLFSLIALGLSAQAQTVSLHGLVTDPSGSYVPGAVVELRGPASGLSTKTDGRGQYSFSSVAAGTYSVRVLAKGFAANQKDALEIAAPVTLDVQLTIEAEAQVVNVQDATNTVSTDPALNGTAVVLGQKELAALSDDPDELSQQLQALAGPGAGPNGGQIYIDGFTGGQLPPKASIREVRVNSNPFAPEYDRPGFGRIEIFTKPGSDRFHGQGFFQFNNQYLNTRSPLLASDLPPYKQQFFGFSIGGPIKKNKASFGLDFEHRIIDENAFVLATTLDASNNPLFVNQAIVTPQTRTSFTPRIDYTINEKNTLVARYQDTRIELDKEGVGNFSLASQAYNQSTTEKTLQLTETAVLGASTINETRFQFLHSRFADTGANSSAALIVQGAFQGGGASAGLSNDSINRFELTNLTTRIHGTHTFKWGARVRESFNSDTSLNNFNGTYTFFGGSGPQLDASLNAIPGTSQDLTALQVYQRTLQLQQAGLTGIQIRALGGGASQLSVNGGAPVANVSQFDIGLFVNDDWRVKPNISLSYGLRYEAQTNISNQKNLSPRIAVAWGVGGSANKAPKAVVRAGFGIFYDRIADTNTLSSERYNGTTQQSYLIQKPDTFPLIPSLSQLQGNSQPQQLQMLYSGLRAPETMQASIGVERQINKHFKLSAQFMESRGIHLLRTLNINTPLNGIYPYGDTNVRLLTESNGFSRSHQLFIAPNVNYKKMFLFGFYSLSYGKDDNEGQPANPYNLRDEWGPSSFADVRHRAVLGTNIPLLWKVSVSPFFVASSGTPYNITTGQQLLGTAVTTARPALLDVSSAQCTGGSLKYETGFGCFDLKPAAGTPTIGRNSARGPASVTLNLRLSRTWSFGNRGESGLNNGGFRPGMGGERGGGPGGPGGGGPPGGGPPPGMFGAASGKRYNLTLTLSARNALNHPNFAAPSGDLSSPYFGQSRSLASGFGPFGGTSTYDRKVDIQLRFQF